MIDSNELNQLSGRPLEMSSHVVFEGSNIKHKASTETHIQQASKPAHNMYTIDQYYDTIEKHIVHNNS